MGINQLNIRIDIRSSLSFIIFSIIAISFTVFILAKADQAIKEIDRLSENRLTLLKEAGVADDLSVIDTSNWKTYRNEKYGFEVRYPTNFKINEELLKLDGPVVFDNFGHKYIHGGILPEGGIEMGITILEGVTSVEEYVKETHETISKEEFSVGGVKGIKIVSSPVFAPTLVYYLVNVYLPKAQDLYILRIGFNANDPKKNEIISTFNSFLSTFKFIESK